MFSQSLRHTQGLELEQRMSLSQALRQKQEQTQKLINNITDLRDELPHPPAKAIDEAFEQMLNALKVPALRAYLEEMYKKPKFREVLSRDLDLLTLPEQRPKLLEFLLNHMFAVTEGKFEWRDKANLEALGEEVIVRRVHFEKALKNSSTLRKEIDSLTEQLQFQGDRGKDITGLLNEIRERKDALKVAEVLTQQNGIETSINLLTVALTTRNAENRPILCDGLREQALLRRYTAVCSERMLNRFVERCDKLLRKGEEEFEVAFLNTVSEYVLISLGIIQPEIFALKTGSLRSDEYENARKSFSELGLDLPELLKHYNLQGPGTIFFHRYAVAAHVPCSITDALIRDFIVSTVREDKEHILEAANYSSFYSKLRELAREHHGTLHREALVDLFESDKFKAAIIDLTKQRWYAQLVIFFPHYSQNTTTL